MNLYVQDLLNDFEYEVKQGHYKKMDYGTWRSLNAQRGSPVEIQISKDLNSVEIWPKDEITLIVGGMEYSFDVWDRSFGEFLNELMQIELNGKSFDALSAATASASNAIQSSCEALNELNKTYSTYTWSDSTTATSMGISNSFYEKQPTVEINEKGLKINGQYVEDIIDEATGNSMKNRKENDSMNLFNNFDFGSCENDNVKMSMYGIAVKNANGTWVSYDAKTENIVDVDILNFDAKYLYKIPVAIKDVEIGNVVIHNRKPMFVSKVEGGKILAIDPAAGEEKVIMLTRSMFGFDFVTKVVNLFGDLSATASADAPFGNMLPLMLLADGGKSDDMLPLMFAMGGGKFDMSNPMMLYFLMKDNKNKDILPFMFFANGQGIAFGKTEAEARDNALNA